MNFDADDDDEDDEAVGVAVHVACVKRTHLVPKTWHQPRCLARPPLNVITQKRKIPKQKQLSSSRPLTEPGQALEVLPEQGQAPGVLPEHVWSECWGCHCDHHLVGMSWGVTGVSP